MSLLTNRLDYLAAVLVALMKKMTPSKGKAFVQCVQCLSLYIDFLKKCFIMCLNDSNLLQNKMRVVP